MGLLALKKSETFVMNQRKGVLLVDNVISLSRTNIRLRERREINLLLANKKYLPYMIVTEPVLLNKPHEFFRTKSFEDQRIEIYYVPNLVIGSLSSNRKLSKFGKLMFGLCNLFLQSVYFLHLTLLVLSLTLVKDIDLIHAHNPPDLTGLVSLLVSRVTKVPYVFEIHDRTPELYCGEMGFAQTSMVYKLMKSIERVVITNSSGLITVNECVAEYFKLFGGPIPIAIYTGTQIDVKNLGKIPLDNQKIQNKRVILYQGSLNMTSIGKSAMYDLTLPLNAMPYILNNVPDTVLVYVGDGSGRLKLEEMTRSMGLIDKVVFTGFISQKQVFDWIRIADVVLVPYADNPNNYTTVPSKLYEYMAVGKPIVATRFLGILEILANEHNGLLYKVGSINEFTNLVLRILNNSKLAERLALNAKLDFVSKYSIEKNWPKLILLYDSITA